MAPGASQGGISLHQWRGEQVMPQPPPSIHAAWNQFSPLDLLYRDTITNRKAFTFVILHSMSDYAIETDGLTKVFSSAWSKRELVAVDNVSIRVPRGSTYGLL